MHIVFASAEAAPFVKTGGLGDVAGSLPAALKKAGADVIVMVPKYGSIAPEWRDQMEHVCDFHVPLGWRNEYCGLERLEHDGITYLFIDNERYFLRDAPYGYFDDGERFAFFSKAICESLQHLPNGWTCDVLHCNDWHTALAPVFLREFYQGLPLYEHVKTVFSIHNIAFQGQFTAKMLEDVLGLAHIPAASGQLTCGQDAINYMQGALSYTDAITTVSPTYAAEIQTPAFGEGLDGVLRRRASVLHGILNGIDTAAFDPATDPRIAQNYTASDRSGKAACKRAVQEELGLEVREDRPLLSMVTRLTRQKGLDLVMYALDRILSGGVQVAVLGTGDRDYEDALRWFERRYPGQMSARIQFDPALSQRIYAGSDLFLMPSLFEPCGLSQIIAMRYGTLPVVRETGGLKDTVAPYNQYTGEGTGFTFANFNGDEMGDAVFRGARLFWDDRAAFDTLVENAMRADFSWKHSAEAYVNLYRSLQPEVPLEAVEEVPEAKAAVEEAPEEREPHAQAAPVAEAEPVAEAASAVESAAHPEPEAEAKQAVKTADEAEPVAKAKSVTKPTAQAEEAAKPVAKAASVTKPKPAAAKPAAAAAKPATSKEPSTVTAEAAEAAARAEEALQEDARKAVATKAPASTAQPSSATVTPAKAPAAQAQSAAASEQVKEAAATTKPAAAPKRAAHTTASASKAAAPVTKKATATKAKAAATSTTAPATEGDTAAAPAPADTQATSTATKATSTTAKTTTRKRTTTRKKATSSVPAASTDSSSTASPTTEAPAAPAKKPATKCRTTRKATGTKSSSATKATKTTRTSRSTKKTTGAGTSTSSSAKKSTRATGTTAKTAKTAKASSTKRSASSASTAATSGSSTASGKATQD